MNTILSLRSPISPSPSLIILLQLPYSLIKSLLYVSHPIFSINHHLIILVSHDHQHKESNIILKSYEFDPFGPLFYMFFPQVARHLGPSPPSDSSPFRPPTRTWRWAQSRHPGPSLRRPGSTAACCPPPCRRRSRTLGEIMGCQRSMDWFKGKS